MGIELGHGGHSREHRAPFCLGLGLWKVPLGNLSPRTQGRQGWEKQHPQSHTVGATAEAAPHPRREERIYTHDRAQLREEVAAPGIKNRLGEPHATREGTTPGPAVKALSDKERVGTQA